MKISKVGSFLCLIVSLCLVSGCSMVGWRSTSEASYELVKAQDNFELRRYGDSVTVETTVAKTWEDASKLGFRLLFNYISGENTSGQKIAMTAPVLLTPSSEAHAPNQKQLPTHTQEYGDGWRMAFVLPVDFVISNVPSPNSSELRVKFSPAGLRVSYQFSGRLREAALGAYSANLISWARAQGFEPVSGPILAGYDPPWTLPMFRRNELLIDVVSTSSKTVN